MYLVCRDKQEQILTSPKLFCFAACWIWWANGLIALTSYFTSRSASFAVAEQIFTVYIPNYFFFSFILSQTTTTRGFFSIILYWLILTLAHCLLRPLQQDTVCRLQFQPRMFFVKDPRLYRGLLNYVIQLEPVRVSAIRSLNRENMQCVVADGLCSDGSPQAESPTILLASRLRLDATNTWICMDSFKENTLIYRYTLVH